MEKVVADTVAIFTGIPLRNDPAQANDQPESLAVIVVDYDGVNPAKLVTRPPAPTPDSDIYCDNFIQRISSVYGMRFSGQ